LNPRRAMQWLAPLVMEPSSLHRAQRALIGPEPTVTEGRFRDDNR
jgi:hypothetical protein